MLMWSDWELTDYLGEGYAWNPDTPYLNRRTPLWRMGLQMRIVWSLWFIAPSIVDISQFGNFLSSEELSCVTKRMSCIRSLVWESPQPCAQSSGMPRGTVPCLAGWERGNLFSVCESDFPSLLLAFHSMLCVVFCYSLSCNTSYMSPGVESLCQLWIKSSPAVSLGLGRSQETGCPLGWTQGCQAGGPQGHQEASSDLHTQGTVRGAADKRNCCGKETGFIVMVSKMFLRERC